MAKAALSTRVKVVQGSLEQQRCEVVVIGWFKGAKRLPQVYGRLDRVAGGVLSDLWGLGDFSGKCCETAVVYPRKKCAAQRILCVGLGSESEVSADIVRRAVGTAVRAVDKLGLASVCIGLVGLIEDDDIDAEMLVRAVTEGAMVGRYAYRDHLSSSADGRSAALRMQITIATGVTGATGSAGVVRKLKAASKFGAVSAEGQNRARALADRPGNEINPPALAREARRMARQAGLRCKVFDDKQLQAMKMNALLAVGSGSAHKARLIRLEHRGRRSTNRPDVVVVGKAITFDSGGLSLKPSASMQNMKFDKCGGCATLGVLGAVAALGLKLNVVGLIPSAENLPSHTSYRPGDIIKTYSGKTVEVQNTDAEGRLILCDALAYAAEMKPRVIVDMATLTGACVVALGEHYAGLFSNNEQVREALARAAEVSGEAVWPMPSGKEYLEQMRSKVADLKNIGGREGASCTAAAFLGEFVGKVPWAHVDIAAVADSDKEKSWRSSGATGFGVRLVLEYLHNWRSRSPG